VADPPGTSSVGGAGERQGVRAAAFLALALALAPAVAGIWWRPRFVTQDGPAHHYNAEVLARSLVPGSPFASAFAVRWRPAPNWAGHALYLGLAAVLPPSLVERAAATVTLVALAAATASLRVRVAGGRGPATSAALSGLVGLNVGWLFGFTGFLLGASLFAVTLGVWWGGRDRMKWRRSLALAALIGLGYLCHPVSLGLTAFGLLVLEAWTPRTQGSRRLLGTLAALSPLLPLGLLYHGLSRDGGPMRPEWVHLGRPSSPAAWAAQLGWVDPVTLAAKVHRPFGTRASMANGLAAPALWAAPALAALAALGFSRLDGERRGWAVLAGLLIFGGMIAPDTLGAGHGHYLPQRVVLLGLVALAPWLPLDAGGPVARLGRAGLFVALGLQSLFVWDYGLESDRAISRLMAGADRVGRGRRVAAVLLDIRGRFRANPRLHADCLLGIGTGNVVWGNYETNYYYFPVRLRDPSRSPPAAELEAIARFDGPANADERARRWAGLLDRYADAIDVVVIDGTDVEIERITARDFDRRWTSDDARVQVWERGGAGPDRR